ncbi:MAG TPA: hypothetical protein VH520_02680 [Streptosporangiaceae bacterium]
MGDQPGLDVLSGSTPAWASVRRVREPVAWTLLLIAAVMVLVSAAQLFDVPGGVGLSVCGGPPTVGPSCFALRASYITSQLADWVVIAPPVLSVVLVAFSGGLTKHARHVLRTVAAVQTGTLMLGVVSLAGATGSDEAGSAYIFDAAELAIAATALIFTIAVIASRAVRSSAPRLQDVGDYHDAPGFGEHD